MQNVKFTEERVMYTDASFSSKSLQMVCKEGHADSHLRHEMTHHLIFLNKLQLNFLLIKAEHWSQE